MRSASARKILRIFLCRTVGTKLTLIPVFLNSLDAHCFEIYRIHIDIERNNKELQFDVFFSVCALFNDREFRLKKECNFKLNKLTALSPEISSFIHFDLSKMKSDGSNQKLIGKGEQSPGAQLV